MQWNNDQAKPESMQQWLHFECDKAGKEVIIILCTQEQLEWASMYGHGQPIYMDATHGMQRYGLKLVTVHVKNARGQGTSMPSLEFCPAIRSTAVSKPSHTTVSNLNSRASNDTNGDHAGLPIVWAIIRSETTAVYETVLKKLKARVEKYRQNTPALIADSVTGTTATQAAHATTADTDTGTSMTAGNEAPATVLGSVAAASSTAVHEAVALIPGNATTRSTEPAQEAAAAVMGNATGGSTATLNECTWEPSSVLVDNSAAEISAIRYVPR